MIDTEHSMDSSGSTAPKQHAYSYGVAGDGTHWSGRASYSDPAGTPVLRNSAERSFQNARYAAAQIANTASTHDYGYSAVGQRTSHAVAHAGTTATANYTYNARREVASALHSADPARNRAYDYDAIIPFGAPRVGFALRVALTSGGGNRDQSAEGDSDPVGAPFTDGATTGYSALSSIFSRPGSPTLETAFTDPRYSKRPISAAAGASAVVTLSELHAKEVLRIRKRAVVHVANLSGLFKPVAGEELVGGGETGV